MMAYKYGGMVQPEHTLMHQRLIVERLKGFVEHLILICRMIFLHRKVLYHIFLFLCSVCFSYTHSRLSIHEVHVLYSQVFPSSFFFEIYFLLFQLFNFQQTTDIESFSLENFVVFFMLGRYK